MKKINWLDHLTNLLVVILGISIAFYLESYKEEKSNKSQEKKYIESIRADLKVDVETLDTLMSINKNISEALVILSDASIGKPYGSDTALMNYLFRIQYNPPFSPQRTTYESLKASGKMDLIGDFELRNKIVDLYEQYYRGTNEFDNSIDEHIRDFIRPFYVENVKFTSGQSVSSGFLPKNRFRNMIFGYRYLFQAKDDFYKTVMERADSLRFDLAEYQANL